MLLDRKANLRQRCRQTGEQPSSQAGDHGPERGDDWRLAGALLKIAVRSGRLSQEAGIGRWRSAKS